MRVKSVINPDITVTWDLRQSKWELKTKSLCKSKLQYIIGQKLKRIYPFDPILEDIIIPDTRLSLDFFLPKRKIAIEVQGKQHDKHVPYFHTRMEDFYKQQDRDERKQMFCDLNSINLLVFSSVKEFDQWIS